MTATLAFVTEVMPPTSKGRTAVEQPMTTASVAFVTVSYGPDRERCAFLSRTLDAYAPSFEHWIVVDRADLPLFASLRNNRTVLVMTEEILPLWLRRLDIRRIGLRSN